MGPEARNDGSIVSSKGVMQNQTERDRRHEQIVERMQLYIKVNGGAMAFCFTETQPAHDEFEHPHYTEDIDVTVVIPDQPGFRRCTIKRQPAAWWQWLYTVLFALVCLRFQAIRIMWQKGATPVEDDQIVVTQYALYRDDVIEAVKRWLGKQCPGLSVPIWLSRF